ncbi:hypothetical protein TVAG_174810 [Trichomonas vaginalis G3]|uniref:Nucleotide-diphospho-sugar transferase domain-containing protein n=1 Tax=Trichomonas vaginalis (strain ATCC PRA-98 / G3) TaxID=412133 RepID=A2EK27_TRIV3|nr:nucleotide-diphospho-sugar transferases family [Trichomonas vaginalis G3]EAY07011.1 hypothetical protein TVAG_174810 [Trichomonas vaginalis G3]KAI5488809.1 nucleotide-diphospho-sugar transferases family [Trichomonas vaginalis G3]|eukprot:XP_001319234.1 hypothetical protein [Trichomonas vaginalis G3]
MIEVPEIVNSTQMEESINFTKAYIGSIEWTNNMTYGEILKNKKYSGCNLCSYKKDNDTIANSTPDDLIIGLLYSDFPNNLLTLVRSIRTTGCKATIAILTCTDVEKQLPPKYLENLENCGVNLVPIPRIGRIQNIHGNLLRHLIFAMFLNQYWKSFNRVVILDVYDTYFQRDPFTTEFNMTNVFFSYESKKFSVNGVNNLWVSRLDANYSKSKYFDKYPLCSGLFVGTSENLVKFYRTFVNLSFWKWVAFKAQDQGTLNAMFYNNKFGDLVQIDPDRKYVSAYLHNFIKSENKTDLVRYDDGVIPRIIHQYDRKQQSSEFIKTACPMLGFWQRKPYARYDWRHIS